VVRLDVGSLGLAFLDDRRRTVAFLAMFEISAFLDHFCSFANDHAINDENHASLI